MKKNYIWWTITGLLVVFIIAIIISWDVNREIIDFTDFETGTIIQEHNRIRVDDVWYRFDEWNLTWTRDNRPVLTRKGTHSFVGEWELLIGIACAIAAACTGVYAYYLWKNEKEKGK